MAVPTLEPTEAPAPVAKLDHEPRRRSSEGREERVGRARDKGKDAVRSLIDGAREAARASAEAAAGSVRGRE